MTNPAWQQLLSQLGSINSPIGGQPSQNPQGGFAQPYGQPNQLQGPANQYQAMFRNMVNQRQQLPYNPLQQPYRPDYGALQQPPQLSALGGLPAQYGGSMPLLLQSILAGRGR